MSEKKLVNLSLEFEEARSLYYRLNELLHECDYGAGVDVWLAPGGHLDVNHDVFLSPGDVAVDHLIEIHDQLAQQLELPSHTNAG